jgi:hypothetical protein
MPDTPAALVERIKRDLWQLSAALAHAPAPAPAGTLTAVEAAVVGVVRRFLAHELALMNATLIVRELLDGARQPRGEQPSCSTTRP